MSGQPRTRPQRGFARKLPARVVAMGGGTGLPAVLRGLRERLKPKSRSAITAVVTMTDDGGSSGRLRRSLGVPPPGDLRNCLVALSENEDLLAALFQHRYDAADDDGVGGHNLGNLILAALAQQTGSFLRAVEVSSNVLRTCGRILPATFDDVVLRATLADGTTREGETAIDAAEQRIESLDVDPADAVTTPGVIEAIEAADLVVIGPGSLYTSVLPNLILHEVGAALARSAAPVILVANLVSEPATRELELADHVALVHRLAGREVIDAVVVHHGPLDPNIVARYEDEGARPMAWDGEPIDGVEVIALPLLAEDRKLRHDPAATVEAVVRAWREVSRRQARPAIEARA